MFKPSLSDLTPLMEAGEALALRAETGVDSAVSMASGNPLAVPPSSSLILLILPTACSSSRMTASSSVKGARLGSSEIRDQPLVVAGWQIEPGTLSRTDGQNAMQGAEGTRARRKVLGEQEQEQEQERG